MSASTTSICALIGYVTARPLPFTVRLHGWNAETDGAVRELHHEGDRSQTAGRDDPPRHQPVLLPLLDVQSRPGALDQRKSLRTRHVLQQTVFSLLLGRRARLWREFYFRPTTVLINYRGTSERVKWTDESAVPAL